MFPNVEFPNAYVVSNLHRAQVKVQTPDKKMLKCENLVILRKRKENAHTCGEW